MLKKGRCRKIIKENIRFRNIKKRSNFVFFNRYVFRHWKLYYGANMNL